MEKLIIKSLFFLLMASGPAGEGACTVYALLVRVPDSIAAVFPADLPILAEFQDAAFNRIDNPYKVIHAGYMVQEGLHLLRCILRGRYPRIIRMGFSDQFL